MRRPFLAATLALVLPATALAARISLPTLLAKQIQAINAAPSAPPVLLPQSMPLGGSHLYPSGGASGSSYNLSIGAVPNCGEATACFIADFSASRAHTVFGERVKVRGASRAGFLPISCGASCSPPQIDFLVHGIRYTIQANLSTSSGDRAVLIGAAQAAIAAGPR